MRSSRRLALLLALLTFLMLLLPGCGEQMDTGSSGIEKQSDLSGEKDGSDGASALKDEELLKSIAYTPSKRKGNLRFTTSVVTTMTDVEMPVEIVTTLARDGRMRAETTMMGATEIAITLPVDGTSYFINDSGELAGMNPCDPALYTDEGSLYEQLVSNGEKLISAQYEELCGLAAICVKKKSGEDGTITLWYSPDYFVELQSEYNLAVRTTTTLVSQEKPASVDDELFALPSVNPMDPAAGGETNKDAVDPRSELPSMETEYYYTADEVQPVVYFIAMKDMKDADGRQFTTSVEGMTKLEAFDNDICYLIRFSEETAEKSLTISYYAVSANGPNIYLMDGITGDYKQIGTMPKK